MEPTLACGSTGCTPQPCCSVQPSSSGTSAPRRGPKPVAPWVQALLVAIAGGGIFGAIAALLRVRPEAGTAAVAQSADALLIMKGLNEELQKERNEWRGEALVLRDRVAELERRVEHLERLLR